MGEKQYVQFRLDGQIYGADISVVREVNYLTPVTRLPNTPDYVDGVLNLRGQVLPVINLRSRLGLAARSGDSDTRVMILDLGDRSAAMVVDGVEAVVTLRDEEMTAPDTGVRLPGQDYVKGVARSGDRLVIVMDLRRLLDVAG